jgi:hypothetical protein
VAAAAGAGPLAAGLLGLLMGGNTSPLGWAGACGWVGSVGAVGLVGALDTSVLPGPAGAAASLLEAVVAAAASLEGAAEGAWGAAGAPAAGAFVLLRTASGAPALLAAASGAPALLVFACSGGEAPDVVVALALAVGGPAPLSSVGSRARFLVACVHVKQNMGSGVL